MKKIFVNITTGAIVIVPVEDSKDYENSIIWNVIGNGSSFECLTLIKNYWKEQNILPENQIYMEEKQKELVLTPNNSLWAW